MSAAAPPLPTPAAWAFRTIAALAEIFTPARPRRTGAAAAAAIAGAPDPERARRFHKEAMPHLESAYSFARYLCRDDHAAEDIVHEAYVRALRGYGGFRGEDIRPWLFAIVRNCFLDSIKAGRDTIALDDAPAATSEKDADHETPETILARKRDAERLRDTIESLPEPFREAIVLRELEELSYKEIAMIAGVPIGTVMSRLARARQMLCDLLVPHDADGRRAAQ
jgi:RNA polymerase sigma factor (sigma-70 family)